MDSQSRKKLRKEQEGVGFDVVLGVFPVVSLVYVGFVLDVLVQPSVEVGGNEGW